MDGHQASTTESDSFAAALPRPFDSDYHELWSCGRCGREFGDCTSCVTHELQCGGQFDRC
jgi:hypothetical protein